jgi:hypothetical protein
MSTHNRNKKFTQNFGWFIGIYDLGDVGVYGTTVLKLMLGKYTA